MCTAFCLRPFQPIFQLSADVGDLQNTEGHQDEDEDNTTQAGVELRRLGIRRVLLLCVSSHGL